MPRATAKESLRLVIGGYDDADAVWRARDALIDAGLARQQLCVFGLAGALAEATHPAEALAWRQVDDMRLAVQSASLFDGIGLGASEPHGRGVSWMAGPQAEALWRHVRSGRPALLACASNPGEEVACSRIQLQHDPRFVHTFNFSR